ncbi:MULTISPECIES: DUF2795 domain-containing protein [Streptomyces]|jgi:hypothetical protein|uniref:DUF2795 domain-containing protein n=1 Tax=Streptomyces radiopugnans TaxID=403935 RepID=A0A1H9BJR9_9ACTN|nr:DUF2795 domain-containing protein [Streptomyces radiopugnans]URN11506.1 DUF2795 domain-containing protein [Streptomyces radiopugnans]SEP89155.1 Protein of unknown function [Streptomyces radiopugnans]
MAKINNPIELQKALGGVDYPADRESLVKNAKEKGAKKEVIDELSSLKKDRFDGPDDVSKAVFGKG